MRPGEEPELVGESGLKKGRKVKGEIDSKALVAIAGSKAIIDSKMKGTSKALIKKRMNSFIQPKWHAPWKLYRVAAGHTGWVRCLAIEPNNEWFATGSNDRTIKIWDLATGKIKLTYTGHVASVRDICISERHPYLFSAGEDKTVKCWDLEQNRVVRHYHGHLSAVNSVKMHPTLNMLFTAGRDCAVRCWDMRSRQNILNLSGHSGSISSMAVQGVDPQIVTGSHDCTVREFGKMVVFEIVNSYFLLNCFYFFKNKCNFLKNLHQSTFSHLLTYYFDLLPSILTHSLSPSSCISNAVFLKRFIAKNFGVPTIILDFSGIAIGFAATTSGYSVHHFRIFGLVVRFSSATFLIQAATANLLNNAPTNILNQNIQFFVAELKGLPRVGEFWLLR